MTARTGLAAAILSSALVSMSMAPPDAPASANAKSIEIGHQLIEPEKLRMHLSFLASDELEGRGTPSRGLDLAARYIASHMEYYGYKPAGELGSYFQKMPMSRRKASRESSLEVEAGGKTVRLNLGVDFVTAGQASQAAGKLAFAGYGLRSKSAGYDDYEGLDVKDRLVIVLDGYPPGVDEGAFKTELRQGNQTVRVNPNRYQIARNAGALGTITVRGPEFTAAPDGKPSAFHQALATLDQERVVFDFRETERPLLIDLTAAAGDALARDLGIDLAAVRQKIAETKKPQPTPIDTTFQLDLKDDIVEKLNTQNVVAFLEGSDPRLKDEIVAFSAHYDHLGLHPGHTTGGPPAQGTPDPIYNGADDDGSGTVGILNLAEVFAAVSRPRRSLLFIWHAGEEKGLLGSEYFVKNPPKPLDKIVALFNIDMIGRNYEDKAQNRDHVFLVGSAKTSKDLDTIIHQACGDRIRLDPNDARNYFRRSDHYHYARNRIPVAFFCTGEHKDYHRPSDEVHAILFDKMEKILEVVFESGLETANRDARPVFTGEGI